MTSGNVNAWYTVEMDEYNKQLPHDARKGLIKKRRLIGTTNPEEIYRAIWRMSKELAIPEDFDDANIEEYLDNFKDEGQDFAAQEEVMAIYRLAGQVFDDLIQLTPDDQ